MKRLFVLSVLLVVFLVFTSTGVSTALDIVPYIGLKDGKWAIWQENGSISQVGYTTIKGKNGQIVREWYTNDGGGWSFDSSEIYKLTSTDLLMIGTNDGTDLWVFNPTLTIPRLMSLNQPVYYNGILKNQRTKATLRVTHVFVITGRGLTVDTQAGTFENCIKFRTYQYSAGTSRDSTTLLASGRGEVKGWVNKIKDTADPQEETQSAFSTEIIQFGDSSPPIP